MLGGMARNRPGRMQRREASAVHSGMLIACVRCVVLALVVALLPACDRTAATLEKARGQAGGAGGRAVAAGTLVAEFPPKGSMVPGDAIDDAAAMIEQAKSMGDTQLSVRATAYAGAVLDAIAGVQGSLQQGAEFEIFWMKVGRLAFFSAEEAFAAGREAEAGTLMLGGGMRWQNEPYWQRYPSHDALVAIVLARSGRREEALERLRSRNDLEGEAARIFQELQKGR